MVQRAIGLGLLVSLVACVADPTSADLSAPDLAMSLDASTQMDGGITAPSFVSQNDGLWGGEIIDVGLADSLNFYAISRKNLYRSTNGAISWERVLPVLPLDSNEDLKVLSVGMRICMGTSKARAFCSPVLVPLNFAELKAAPDLGAAISGPIVGLVELSASEVLIATMNDLLQWDGSSFQSYEEGLPPTGTNRALFLGRQLEQAVWLVRNSEIYYRKTNENAWTKTAAAVETVWGFSSTISRTYLAFAETSSTKLLDVTTTSTLTACTGSPMLDLALGVTESGRLLRRTYGTYEAASSCTSAWTTISTDISSAIRTARPYGETLYGVGAKGLFRILVQAQTETSTIAEVDSGIEAQHVRSFAAPSDRPGRIFAATNTGLFRFDLGASTWTRVAFPPLDKYLTISSIQFSPLVPAVGIAIIGETYPLQLSVTQDHGDSWVSPTNGKFSSLAFDPHQNRLLACLGDVLKESTDNGQTWTALVPDGGTSTIDKCKFVVAHPQQDVFFAAADKDRIWRSTDGGISWTQLATGVLPSLAIDQLLVDPLSIDHVFVSLVTVGVLEVKVDNDNPVTPFYQPSPGTTVTALARDPVNPLILYATHPEGAAMSSDGGKTWIPIASASGEYGTAIFVHPADRRQRWLGTAYHGAMYSSGDYLP